MYVCRTYMHVHIHTYTYINKICMLVSVCICMYKSVYTHRPTYTHSKDYTEKSSTIHFHTIPNHTAASSPSLFFIHITDLSEIIASYLVLGFLYSSDFGVQMRTPDCSKEEQSRAPPTDQRILS